MKIGIVSPSAPSTYIPERKAQFEKGIEVLRSLGFEISLSSHAGNSLSYISDTVENRLEDLHAFYGDNSIEAILCANGGWNSNQLIDKLDYELIKNNPKPLIGYSDISVLLNAIYKKTGVKNIHGPMVTWGFFENDEFTNNDFSKALSKKEREYKTTEIGSFMRGNNLRGSLVGGNLVSVEALLGTPYEPDWTGKVFFWEETEEDVSHIDRSLTHFKNAGVWDKISGIIIGRQDEIMEEYEGMKVPVWDMIRNHFRDYSFPIFRTEFFGHGTPKQLSLPIGGNIDIDSENISLKLDHLFGLE